MGALEKLDSRALVNMVNALRHFLHGMGDKSSAPQTITVPPCLGVRGDTNSEHVVLGVVDRRENRT